MAYRKCPLSKVPMTSRTREFYIANFSNEEVNNYIKSHIEDFDREFFKDLIATNEYATKFNTNCFEVMPLEYIDEEMCSLGIMNSLNWTDYNWLYSVCKRKKEVLTKDIWCLSARLYSRMNNDIFEITPEEYKDEDYYIETCLCNFNYGMELEENKGKIMNKIPENIITQNSY